MPPPGVCQNIMDARLKQDGFGTVSNPDRFLQQDYQKLKEHFLIINHRYIDDKFPPDRTSIGPSFLKDSDLARVEWLRPGKIVSNPSFVLDGISRFDFGQGSVGNCWFLASIGALTFRNHILHQVVPVEQTFEKNYCGLFHFRFWRFGRWVDVVIDDKLPTINGRLIFVRSRDPNEFWPALLEKAYAKVCGSYKDMVSGTPSEAMRDFTGGVHMCIQLFKPSPNLWEFLCRATRSGTLMSCDTPRLGEKCGNVSLNGLVQGHSYTVTGLKQIQIEGNVVNLVRLWNPWGTGEWTGDWSDRSSLWQSVSSTDRQMCLSVADDGEFWMSLEDFCRLYTNVDICGLTPDFLDGNSSHWKSSTYEGRWVAGTTAGGCMENKKTFWSNPQYRINVYGTNSKNEDSKNILISLMQKPDKRNRRLVQNLTIEVTIFEITDQYKTHRGKFPASFFSSQNPVAKTQTSSMDLREVMEFLTLQPGEYVIVPSTFNPNDTASFILTILSREETQCYETSGYYMCESVEKVKKDKNGQETENKKKFFRQYSDKYEEVDAEQLQRLLNENILQGDLKSGGFSLDACRSMVALMDASVTGKLNSDEFVRLWNKVTKYKDTFYKTDVSKTGTLSLSELRNAFKDSGRRVSDEMLNLMALRYGASSGHITLESFISLILRLDCMFKIFERLSRGKSLTLSETEWMYVSMYT